MGASDAHAGRPGQPRRPQRGPLVRRRAARAPPAEPWAGAPWDDDPDWEFRTAPDLEPGGAARPLRRDVRAQPRQHRRGRRPPAGSTTSRLPTPRPPDERFNLRWILLHMLEETARHNGHADLLREATDGETGDRPRPALLRRLTRVQGCRHGVQGMAHPRPPGDRGHHPQLGAAQAVRRRGDGQGLQRRFATTAYPEFQDTPPEKFASMLSTGEIAVGALLLDARRADGGGRAWR